MQQRISFSFGCSLSQECTNRIEILRFAQTSIVNMINVEHGTYPTLRFIGSGWRSIKKVAQDDGLIGGLKLIVRSLRTFTEWDKLRIEFLPVFLMS